MNADDKTNVRRAEPERYDVVVLSPRTGAIVRQEDLDVVGLYADNTAEIEVKLADRTNKSSVQNGNWRVTLYDPRPGINNLLAAVVNGAPNTTVYDIEVEPAATLTDLELTSVYTPNNHVRFDGTITSYYANSLLYLYLYDSVGNLIDEKGPIDEQARMMPFSEEFGMNLVPGELYIAEAKHMADGTTHGLHSVAYEFR